MVFKSSLANPNKQRSPRHRAREFALQGIYQWLLNQEDAKSINAYTQQAHGFSKADKEHFEILLHGVLQHVNDLRTALGPMLDRPIHELSPVEHASLLIGAFELAHHPEIPYRVIINEAVELTKSFGGIDGHKYVNGVLDKLASTLRPQESRE
jgi:N utilization substance protein B